MRSIKKSVASTIAGLTASALFASATCAAVTVTVNDEAPLKIQSSEGFSYLIAGDAGFLNVMTDGFLFCANVYPDVPPNLNQVVLVPQHGDWALPTAIDLLNFSYSGSQLLINRSSSGSLDSSLVCHAVGAQGETTTPFTDGIFDNGVETKTLEQYPNLINWIPPQGWNWNSPNWPAVPTDPCSPSVDQPARVDEDITCAAVSGARPGAAGGTTRSPTMWTGTDGSNYFYVMRVDARYGAQTDVDDTGPLAPQQADASGPDGSTGSVTIKVSDGYDRGSIGQGGPGYLGDIGVYCILTDLPSTLDGNVCTGAVFSDGLIGPLSYRFVLSILPPSNPRASFYIAFIRPIVGGPPALTEPAVGASILIEPSVVAEGGDRFKGDDVVFGFLPNSQGFPWMSGQ
jgi:hypothetical protein